ncbi:MAG TPA: DNA mismatch repair endonuclease MutL [Bacteroidia bacterium]|nr:DNA mismatch repair endonuclease MutL [Bacteroidia bacterium]
MSDIIRLLPDTVANQIAAGEVIQRPASAVKELLENAVDAGSSRIELYVKDSGKTLLQITDDGCGMSPTDARLSFARHATSKIRTADDLFSIRTKGFRGEALASIAAIAQVELKTKRHDDELGTQVIIEGNEVKNQEAVSVPSGTTISVKNLFYNVPARRNFLKSNPVEARHIIDEFERVALAHPDIFMSLHQNGLEIFKLASSNLRQRIVGVYGSHYNERLVPVQEETTLLSITGFAGKPEFSKKTRGEQFFFVNRRFIKDHYLHHAVSNAFEELLPRDSYPSYWLYIDIDPSKIDVNIHPTKTEIKFEDERSVYAIVRAAVKRALGQYSVSPALDFDQENSFTIPHSLRHQPAQKPTVTVNTGYNPFQTERSKSISGAGWEKLYEGIHSIQDEPEILLHQQKKILSNEELQSPEQQTPSQTIRFQLNQEFIVHRIAEGLLIIDQQAAHERILFERFFNPADPEKSGAQQDLFPQTLNFSSSDFDLLKELEPDIRALGFDIREFGGNSFVLHGSPAGIEKGLEKEILEQVLEQYKNYHSVFSTGIRESLAKSMARSLAIKKGKLLTDAEMRSITDDLLLCEKPSSGIDGKPCMSLLKTDDLRDRFK